LGRGREVACEEKKELSNHKRKLAEDYNYKLLSPPFKASYFSYLFHFRWRCGKFLQFLSYTYVLPSPAIRIPPSIPLFNMLSKLGQMLFPLRQFSATAIKTQKFVQCARFISAAKYLGFAAVLA